MKKLTIVAALAMAVAVLAVPGTAGAIWTDNHSHIRAGVNPQIHTEGEFGYASESGNIHCTQVTLTVQLTGGQTTGHVNQFSKNSPQTQCHTEGALGHCTVTSTQPTNLPWLIHVNQAQTGVTVTGVHLHSDLHGFLCPDLTIHLNDPMDFVELTGEEGQGFDKTGKHTTIQGTDLEGTLTATPLGTLAITGTFTPTSGQQARYGWT